MTTDKLIEFKKAILEKYPEFLEAELIDENLKIASASQLLENVKGLIDFSFNYRESENESWLQCEYYSNKLKKAIIFDYDIFQSFETDGEITALDKFVLTLADYQELITEFENKISINN